MLIKDANLNSNIEAQGESGKIYMLGHVWDPIGLAWVKDTGSSGGGGGTSDATAANQALEISELQDINNALAAQATAANQTSELTKLDSLIAKDFSTSAKQDTGNASLSSIDGKATSTNTKLDSLITELQLKADLTEIQPVSGPVTDAQLRASSVGILENNDDVYTATQINDTFQDYIIEINGRSTCFVTLTYVSGSTGDTTLTASGSINGTDYVNLNITDPSTLDGAVSLGSITRSWGALGTQPYLINTSGVKYLKIQLSQPGLFTSRLAVGPASASNVITQIMAYTYVKNSGDFDVQNITGTVSLPTGASTSALQTTANTKLDSLIAKDFATSAKQDTLNTSINTLLKPASTLAAVTTVGAVTAITNALPAGNNNIGDVDIASALPAGTNNIGDVDVLSIVNSTDTVATGTLTALNDECVVATNGAGGAHFSISGTWVGQATFQYSPDNQVTWNNMNVYHRTTGAAAITTTTANTEQAANVGAFTHVKIKRTLATSGSMTVRINCTQAPIYVHAISQNANNFSVTAQPGNVANTTPWLVKPHDGTTAITVKAASTAAVATDTALVVAISPNNTIPAQGAKTNNNAAPGATNFGTLPSVATASAPSYTEGNQVSLSADLAGALRSIDRPISNALGFYSLASDVGYTATTQNGEILSFRWGDATRLCIPLRIRVQVLATAFTTAGVVERQLILARSYTVAATGGTALTPSSNSAKYRTSFGTSLVSDIRIGGFLSAGTRTLDSFPISTVSGWMSAVGTVIPLTDLYNISSTVSHPIVLAQNEGFLIRLGGAETASTRRTFVTVEYAEVTAY